MTRSQMHDREPAAVSELVRRIVAVAHPDRIILFGSAARGTVGPDSDLDVLVVKAGVPHRRQLAQEIHRALFGIGVPVDVIVMTPEDVDALCDAVGSFVSAALREGRELHAA